MDIVPGISRVIEEKLGPGLRNSTYFFLNQRANDFIRERMPGVPRADRRRAAKQIARRFMKRVGEEHASI